MEVVPFAEEHLDAAAELLTARHEAHRRVFPQLPEADYRAEIAALLEQGATGAFTEGAYVLGKSGRVERWGPNIWVEAAGHAASDPERLRDVWAEAAAGWVEQGLRAHYALVPATDTSLLDAWFRLGFGAQHGHDGMTKSFQVAEERSSHAFTIHHHSHGCCFPFDLMRASQNLGKSHGQVLVFPMRHC